MARDVIRRRIDEVVPEATRHLATAGRTTVRALGRRAPAARHGRRADAAAAPLVLDEPLANLDPLTAHRLLEGPCTWRIGAPPSSSSSTVSRSRSTLRPDRVLYLEEGVARYLGEMAGFLAIADPGAVKVPFAVSLATAQDRSWWRSLGRAPGSGGRQSPETVRLEWHKVDAGYDGRVVLHDVSVSLGRSQRVAVLGPNGSGKTTLFKAAIGLIPLLAGEVNVDGAPRPGGVAALAGTFGYVFQNPSQMLFAPTVEDEILFGPRNLGRDPDRFAGPGHGRTHARWPRRRAPDS